MKRKPWAIIILAILHIFAPLGNLIINAHWLHHSLLEHWNYWMNFMPRILFMTYVVLPVIAGVAIFICRRWSYWIYLGCLGLIFTSNIYSFYTDVSLVKFLFLLFVLIVDLLAVAYFVVPAVRVVYMDPKLRWWESAPRFQFAHIIDINKRLNAGHIKNISEGGAFLTTEFPLKEGNRISLTWDFENHYYQVSAVVVFKNTRANAEGYGVQFNHTNESKKQIKRLCAKLKVSGLLIQTVVPGPEDSFGNWLKKLIFSREGLFPKTGRQR